MIGQLSPYLYGLRSVWRFLPVGMVLGFIPISIAFIEGQGSVILLALMVAAMVATDKQKPFTGGILLGLTLFKFQYAIPIALLFTVWRRWRFLAGFALCAVAVSTLSVWLTGYGGTEAYLRYLLSISKNYSAANGAHFGVHPEGMANLRGLVTSLVPLSSGSAFLLTLGLSAIVLVWASKKQPSLPGALLAAALVSYHSVISDASMLILPLGMAFAACQEGSQPRRSIVAIFTTAALIGPALLLFVDKRFFLLTIALLGVFITWDGRCPQRLGTSAGGDRKAMC